MKTTTPPSLEEELKDVNRQMYERNYELAIRNRTLSTLRKMYEIMNVTLGTEDTAYKLLNAIIGEFKFKGVSIAILNKKEKMIKTIAAASSSHLTNIGMKFVNQFMNLELPLGSRNNIISAAIRTRKKQTTHVMHDLLVPLVGKEQSGLVQALFGIQTFILYPFRFGNEINGVLIISLDKKISQLSIAEKEGIHEIVELIGIALERAKIYANLKIANQKLKELDKMKDDFVSVASHELRTPMTAIKSYLWLALAGKGGKLSTKQEYYLQRSYNSVDRLIKLVNDMLNISRIESGRIFVSLAKIDIVDLVTEVVEEIKPRIDELKIKISIDFGNKGTLSRSEIKLVIADVDKIKEVVLNLIGNSLKFTEPGGTISIFFTKDGDKIITNVKDSGHGIDAKDMPTLFTKFGMIQGSYATNKKASGTGLGLYISKSIIELHGGEIQGASEGVGKGSTFSFSLLDYSTAMLKKMTSKLDNGSRDQTIGIIHTSI